jgi:proteasome lid subunit RPN8/RPN11
MIEVLGETLAQIKKWAEDSYPYEACGILIGSALAESKRVTRVMPAVNRRADSPHNRYLIDPETIHRLEVSLRGSDQAILGFFHSHPDAPASPSEYDRRHAWPWYSYLIVSVLDGRAGEVVCWKLKDDRSGFDSEPIQPTNNGGRVDGS